jgi:hypothetical protein
MHDPPDHVQPSSRFQLLGLKVPIAASDPGAFESFEAYRGLLKNVHVGGGKAFAIFKINVEHVNAPFANPSNPRDLQPVLEVFMDAALGGGRNANASPGNSGASSRPMVHRGAMRTREDGIPAKAARLPLGSFDITIGQNFSLLGDDNVGLGPIEHGILKRVP